MTGSIDQVALSVILCVRNGAPTMRTQLDALLAQTWDQPWEIVVVDNGSIDDSADIARQYAAKDPRVRLVDASQRRGLSYARNVGVTAASGSAVAFCDDDDVVGEGWVAAMGEALAGHRVVAARMEYESLSDPDALTGRAAFQSERVEELYGYPVVNGASGWRRDLWVELGGNDESLDFSGEDFDMALRAHLHAGATPHFAPGAVYHARRRSGGRATLRQARRYGRAMVVLDRRYGRGRPGVPEPWARVLRQWAWLVRHILDVGSSRRRTLWCWRAGMRAGRLEQHLRDLVMPGRRAR